MAFERFTLRGSRSRGHLTASITDSFNFYLSSVVAKRLGHKQGDRAILLFDKETKMIGLILSPDGVCVSATANGAGMNVATSSFCRHYNIRRGQYKLPVQIIEHEGKQCATVVVETVEPVILSQGYGKRQNEKADQE